MAKRTVWLLSGAGALLAAAALAFWLLAPFGEAEAQPVAIDPNDAALVTLGRQVYVDQCAVCHGANLEGEANWRQRKPSGRMPAPPHDASGHTWHHADNLLFSITKYGIAETVGRPVESDMPAFRDLLSDREIAASLAYIKSTWPLEIRQRHDAMNQRAQ